MTGILINMEIPESLIEACFDGDNVTAGCNASFLFSADLSKFQQDADLEALRRPWLAAIVIIVYVVVLAFGVLGNGLVFVTVASAPRMRTATNIFIANLALADCFVCAFDLPLNLHYQVDIATSSQN